MWPRGLVWANEWVAAWASHRLVADHPVIAEHLATRRSRRSIAMIPYGGSAAGAPPDKEAVRGFGCKARRAT